MSLSLSRVVRRSYLCLRQLHAAVGGSPGPEALPDDRRRCLSIRWDTSLTTLHPYIWLKDACQCPVCFSQTFNQRLTDLAALDLGCRPLEVNFEASKRQVTVRWDDDHRSFYPYSFLATHCFLPRSQRRQRRRLFGRQTTLWDSSLVLTRFPWSGVQAGGELMGLMKEVERSGVALVTDVPDRGLEALVTAIAFPTVSHHGAWVEVRGKARPSSVAYTSARVGMHTDNPCCQNPQGVQFLLCVERKEVEGGESFLADGFFAAEQLRKNHPDEFRMLARVPVQFYDRGSDYLEDYHLVNRHCVIGVDRSGRCYRIVYSEHMRDFYPCVQAEHVDDFFRALKLFHETLMSNAVYHTLSTGEMLVMDNQRLTHGRTEMRMTENGERHLRGAYIGWDEFRSRMRRLRDKLDES